MGASFFEFKQFKVAQDRCAMKVCTDSCLFGAICAAHYKNQLNAQHKILDIGGGTGLLALMLAQKIGAAIHAVEIDEAACRQMKENFENAAFHDRLQAHCADINGWGSDLKFDLVISNPPFFENSLKSPNAGRNRAMHHDHLSFKMLASQIHLRLQPGGSAVILAPWHRADEMCRYMEEVQLYCYRSIDIQHTNGHAHFRTVLFFGREKNKVEKNEMTIKENDGTYTQEFSELLKDYYLGNK